MSDQKKRGRKSVPVEEKAVNIQCYMKKDEYVKMGRRQAAVMARHFIKQLNELIEEGEPVIISSDFFKVVRS